VRVHRQFAALNVNNAALFLNVVRLRRRRAR